MLLFKFKKSKFDLFITLNIIVYILSAWPINAKANISASIDPSFGNLGESFTYTVSIEGNVDREPNFPDVDGITVTGTANSSQIQIINGKMSRLISVSYYLHVQKPGNYTIPAVTAEVDGKMEQSNSVSFKVNKAENQLKGEDEDHPEVFVVRELSNNSPYVGQAILSTSNLYYRIQIAEKQRQAEKIPNSKLLEIGKRQGKHNYKGIDYEILQYQDIIIPERKGSFTLPGDQFLIQIVTARRSQRRDLFSEFFSGSMGQVTERSLSSKEEILTVKEIPNNGRPPSYDGIVGSFRLESSISTDRIKVGETATLTITINGQGSLEGMRKITLDLNPSVKIYPDKPVNKEDAIFDKGLYSTRSLKFALVASKADNLDLGEFSLTTFNPEKEAFENLSIPLGSLVVEPASENEKQIIASPENISTNINKNIVTTIGKDLINLHRNFSVTESHSIQGHIINLVLIILIPLLSLLALIIFKFFKRQTENPSKRRIKANAYKVYKENKLLWEKNNINNLNDVDAISSFYTIYKNYLGDKFGVQASSLTTKEIYSYFSNTEILLKYQGKAVELSNYIDRLHYSQGKLPEEKFIEIVKDIDVLVGVLNENITH